ncbi:hypothetical protein J2T58_001291 [Methanocalculus alkaliphilus]|uniref:DUF4276 family protein n=1 Tax=Methanocalculus alkaliphilus TaxID=768730 RepID=UPI0020A06D9C|nr:DUF4276 family protein [Methanocalculus alkaliphilus]MCP1715426.1 hypothetical protein [Methanocalculus alkaliphilus]
MIRLKIITEGQTEEGFVSQILAPHLRQFHIEAFAINLPTAVREKTHRGGIMPYDRVRKIILQSFEKQGAYVTTMFDLYKLPETFPGMDEAERISNPHTRVETIESALQASINNRFFIPYIQVHEFEALLFSDVTTIDEVMTAQERSRIHDLDMIIRQFPNGPESINDGEETAPSKRLLKLYPSYQKRTRGIQIARRIALGTMREECPHFDAWIARLEKLSGGRL